MTVKSGEHAARTDRGSSTRRPRWVKPRILLILVAIAAGMLFAGRLSASLLWPDDGSADVGFIRDMTAHHNQAVEMADIVRQRTEDYELRAVAQEIVLVQQWQIGRMQGWLDVWGVPLISDRPRMAWMGDEGMTTTTMPGMASYEEIRQLEQLPMAAMEEQFLRLMIRHHQGGVQMAEAALERADRPEVRELAQAIKATQEYEIGVMQDILARKGWAPEPVLAGAPAADHSGHGAMTASMNSAEAGAAHAEGFTASVPDTVQGIIRFGPPLVLIFAMVALMLDLIRERRRGAGFNRLTPVMQRWQTVAVGGLLASAILHAGLTPDHLREGAGFGLAFAAAALALAVVAAAILVAPSRPAYLGGAALAAGLIAIWVLFRIVPPPGADAAEGIDLVGLVTKAAEVAAFAGCIVLWRHAGGVATMDEPPAPRRRTRRYARTAS